MKKICLLLVGASISLTMMSFQSIAPSDSIGDAGNGPAPEGFKRCRDGSRITPPFFKRTCNDCKTRFANWSGRGNCRS